MILFETSLRDHEYIAVRHDDRFVDDVNSVTHFVEILHQ